MHIIYPARQYALVQDAVAHFGTQVMFRRLLDIQPVLLVFITIVNHQPECPGKLDLGT